MAYLIQRVIKNKTINTKAKGVDRHFSFDYMGSSEFEFGALPKALLFMKSGVCIKRRIFHKISAFGDINAECYFVGNELKYEAASEFFNLQITSKGSAPRLKERSRLFDQYIQKVRGQNDVIGWWAIDSDWIIFRYPEDAVTWFNNLA